MIEPRKFAIDFTSCAGHRRRRPGDARRGLSLLEVIVALAILGMALAALGVLVRLGLRNAKQARDGTTAQIIAESLMSEVTAGSLPPESVGPAQYDEFWSYSINVVPLQDPPLPLVEVHVSVQEIASDGVHPVSFDLVRWMPDPSVELPSDSAAVVEEETEGEMEMLEF